MFDKVISQHNNLRNKKNSSKKINTCGFAENHSY